MDTKRYLFTSESVTEGHPDKIADQISDAVLDAIIGEDPDAHVACETLVTTGLAMIAGEITTRTYVHLPEIVRRTICDIGYNDAEMGFDCETCAVVSSIDRQSPDIALGVNAKFDKMVQKRGLKGEKEIREAKKELQGAGDQGIMFGYACRETPELMPLPIALAHALAKRLSVVRKKGVLDWVRPDGKTQVTVEYDGYTPVRVHTVVVSTQHKPTVSPKQIREAMIEEVIRPTVPERLLDKKTIFHVNPTGRFVHGGPKADCGLTGRKIIVDTYGGMGAHGGGAFSGKDPSKVDRSGSYMARYVAKNVVASGLATKCEVQIAYAIGVARPVSLMVHTFKTGTLPDEQIKAAVDQVFDLRPAAIIEALDLLKPIYRRTAAYGHFGRNTAHLRWEKTDRAAELKKIASR